MFWSQVNSLQMQQSPVNSLRPRKKRRHFANDTFKRIFLKENVWIPITISQKFVPKGPINNIPALVQIMAWRRTGDKPLSEPMMVRLPTHICVIRPQWVNEWYNATQNWRKNKSTTLFADQIHTYDCTQYCIIECLKILIIYDDTPLKVWCETKYTYTTKSNRINRHEIHIQHKIQ